MAVKGHTYQYCDKDTELVNGKYAKNTAWLFRYKLSWGTIRWNLISQDPSIYVLPS